MTDDKLAANRKARAERKAAYLRAIADKHAARFRAATGDAATVAADHLHPGVPPEPVREGVGSAVRQEIDHAPPLEVAKDRAIPPATAPRPVVHPEHARGLARRLRRAAAEHAEQGGGADRHGQPERQARSGLAAQGEADVALDVGQADSPARPWRGDLGQPFGEDPARAAVRGAAEPPGPDMEGDEAPLPWQVCQDAPVVAVDPVRGLPAQRAGAGG